MRRVSIFLVALGIFLALIWMVSNSAPSSNPFASAPFEKPFALGKISTGSQLKLKMDFARTVPAFDIGVFGNSRSLPVTKGALDLGNCRLFNFSIGGESIRNTVAMLRLLARAGKLPGLSVINVDHFELQMYSNPFGLSFTDRMRFMLVDLWAGLSDDRITLHQWAKMVWRHLWSEANIFKRSFELQFFLDGAKRWLGLVGGVRYMKQAEGNYRSDGSRTMRAFEATEAAQGVYRSAGAQILMGYLARDLETVAGLQADGAKVVLYESLLNPESEDWYRRHPTPYARASRHAFKDACSRLKLDCRLPDLSTDEKRLPWPNHTHAPAPVINDIVNRIVQSVQPDCLG